MTVKLKRQARQLRSEMNTGKFSHSDEIQNIKVQYSIQFR